MILIRLITAYYLSMLSRYGRAVSRVQATMCIIQVKTRRALFVIANSCLSDHHKGEMSICL